MEIKDIGNADRGCFKKQPDQLCAGGERNEALLKEREGERDRCDSRSSAWFCAGFRSSHDEPAGLRLFKYPALLRLLAQRRLQRMQRAEISLPAIR